MPRASVLQNACYILQRIKNIYKSSSIRADFNELLSTLKIYRLTTLNVINMGIIGKFILNNAFKILRSTENTSKTASCTVLDTESFRTVFSVSPTVSAHLATRDHYSAVQQ